MRLISLLVCFVTADAFIFQSFFGPSSAIQRRNLQLLRAAGAKSKRDRNLEEIFDKISFSRPENRPKESLENDPLYPQVETILLAASARKAPYMMACRVTQLTEVTQFMIILEGNSRPQNQAIAGSIEDVMQEMFDEKPSKQGNAAGGWILLDYGSIIVHVMTPQMRNFYKLESRWKNAETVDISLVLEKEVGRGRPGLPTGVASSRFSDDENDDASDDRDDEEDDDDGEEGQQDTDEDDPFWK